MYISSFAYFSGDLLGKLLAFISLTPLAIGVCLITLIAFRRDMHTVSSFSTTKRERKELPLPSDAPIASSNGSAVSFVCVSRKHIRESSSKKHLCIRSSPQIFFSLGLVLNEATNYTLKHLIREPRPLKRSEEMTVEFGMPSSHSQFMWFVATYLMFFITFR